MEEKRFVQDYLDRLTRLIHLLDPEAIRTAVEWVRETAVAGNTIFLCGNGGSASIASQMVVDLVKGATIGKGIPFRVLSLGDSIATLTAYANDLAYESVFVEPFKTFSRQGDLLIAISGSGNSPNVLRVVEQANTSECRTIGLTSGTGGRLREIAQLPLTVPDSHMGRLEDCFFIMTHIICYAFMEGVF